MYADDIVLLATSAEMMKQMCEVVSEFARKRRFEVNHGKSKLVVFGPQPVREAAKGVNWVLGGNSIEVVDSYKYLGAEVAASGRKWAQLIDRLETTGSEFVNQLLWQGHGPWGCRPRTYA